MNKNKLLIWYNTIQTKKVFNSQHFQSPLQTTFIKYWRNTLMMLTQHMVSLRKLLKEWNKQILIKVDSVVLFDGDVQRLKNSMSDLALRCFQNPNYKLKWHSLIVSFW